MLKPIEFLYFLPMGSLNHVENGNQKKKGGSRANFFITDFWGKKLFSIFPKTWGKI